MDKSHSRLIYVCFYIGLSRAVETKAAVEATEDEKALDLGMTGALNVFQ